MAGATRPIQLGTTRGVTELFLDANFQATDTPIERVLWPIEVLRPTG